MATMQTHEVKHEPWENFTHLLSKALHVLDDCFELNEIPTLSRLPAMHQWAQAHPEEWVGRGKALQLYLRQAVDDVLAVCHASQSKTLLRLGHFIERHYLGQEYVAVIARQTGVSRSTLTHRVMPHAVELIAKRFVALVRTAEHGGKS